MNADTKVIVWMIVTGVLALSIVPFILLCLFAGDEWFEFGTELRKAANRAAKKKE